MKTFEVIFRRPFSKINGADIFSIRTWLEIDYENESVDSIVEKLQFAIEQHPTLLKVIPQEEFIKEEELNKKRRWEY